MSGSVLRIRAATIDALGQAPAPDAVVGPRAQLGTAAIGYYTFSAELTAECDDVGSCYYVYLPLAGRAEVRHRGVDLAVRPGVAAILSPETGSFRGHWTSGSRALCVALDQASVNAGLARLTGGHLSARPRFAQTMDAAHGLARGWAELLLSLRRQVASSDPLLFNPLVADPLAESVLNGFLLAAQVQPGTVVAAAGPLAVRTAVDHIEASPLEPWTVSTLAIRCQVSVRALQQGFRDQLGMSPMAYLRDARMRGAHEDLRTADPFAESVASIARRWGFTHMGRFAQAHERKYGQTPLRVLRAAR